MQFRGKISNIYAIYVEFYVNLEFKIDFYKTSCYILGVINVELHKHPLGPHDLSCGCICCFFIHIFPLIHTGVSKAED